MCKRSFDRLPFKGEGMFKLAVFDLDGTLLDDHHDISEANKRAILKLAKMNCKVVLATGRPDMLVKEYVAKLGIQTPVISCNGAMIREPFTQEVMYQQALSKEDVFKVLKLCRDYGYIYMAYASDVIVTTNNDRTKYFEERNKTLDESCQATFIIENDVNRISERYEIFKILIIERNCDRYKKMCQQLEALSHLTKVSSANGFYDIMSKDTSKKHAINRLLDYYQIDKKEVVAFGDNYNDIEMLDFVGTAVTMANGVPEVKALADYISLDHSDNGVAYAIEHFILKNTEE